MSPSKSRLLQVAVERALGVSGTEQSATPLTPPVPLLPAGPREGRPSLHDGRRLSHRLARTAGGKFYFYHPLISLPRKKTFC